MCINYVQMWVKQWLGVFEMMLHVCYVTRANHSLT